jgi:hypothetical protein
MTIDMEQVDPSLRGKCKEAAEALCAADPMLRLVRGYYYDAVWGPQAHWWCERPDGTIVDPTAAQFPTQGGGVYEPLEGEDVQVSCEECGKAIRESEAHWMGHYPTCSRLCAGRLVGVIL